MTQKSPLPLLAALLAGAGLMFLGSKSHKQNPVEDEVPTSLDYDDEELKDALRQTVGDTDSEGEDE